MPFLLVIMNYILKLSVGCCTHTPFLQRIPSQKVRHARYCVVSIAYFLPFVFQDRDPPNLFRRLLGCRILHTRVALRCIVCTSDDKSLAFDCLAVQRFGLGMVILCVSFARISGTSG